MKEFSFFKYEKISDNTTRIFGPTQELMYLIEGNDRAVLIDTGTGVGNLKALVDSLTNKPYFVILTHGHLDHAMGASVFEDVYMNPADNEVYKLHSNMMMRKEYLKMNMGENFAKIKEEDYILASPCNRFQTVLPGDTFDLGGINLEICIGAGHTLGSITILIVQERALLLGDACNYFTFLFDEHSLGVTSYEKNLLELDKYTKGHYDKVYLSHGDGNAPKEMLQSVIELCEDIKAGNTDDVPFKFLTYNAFLAKALDETWKRVDGGIGNIVYNKEKVNE
jgi:glyoxylase-like metal-dependent hydrolase (beta-lactamase superfamily II)